MFVKKKPMQRSSDTDFSHWDIPASFEDCSSKELNLYGISMNLQQVQQQEYSNEYSAGLKRIISFFRWTSYHVGFERSMTWTKMLIASFGASSATPFAAEREKDQFDEYRTHAAILLHAPPSEMRGHLIDFLETLCCSNHLRCSDASFCLGCHHHFR